MLLSVIMELGEMFFMIIASACVNILVIVAVYSYWIIPTIVARVKDELMVSIQQWITSTKDDLSNTIVLNIDEMRQKLVGVISGYRGNKARQMSLAQQFLAANLDDPDDLDNEASEDVITQAIATYGEKIVKAALKSIKAKPPAADPEKEPAAVW